MTNSTQQMPPALNDDQDDVSIARYLDIIRANMWLIGTVTAITLFLGGLYAFLGTPIYQADLLIQVEDSNSTASSALSELSSVFDVKTQAATEIQIIGSRLVVGAAVRDLKLYIKVVPKRFPLIGDLFAGPNNPLSDIAFFRMGGYNWGVENLQVPKFEVPASLVNKEFTVVLEPEGRYRLSYADKNISVEGVVGKDGEFVTPLGKISVMIASAVGNPGSQFALTRKSMPAAISDLQGSLNLMEAAKDSDIIDVTLQGPDAALAARTLRAIGDEYVKQNVARKAAEATQQLSFLNNLLPNLKQDLIRAEGKYNDFRNAKGTIDLNAEGALLLQQSVDLQTKIEEAQVQRAQLVTRFTAMHPSVLAIDEQLTALRSSLANISTRVHGLPDMQQQAVGLMRDVQVDTQIYTTLLANSEQLRVTEAGKVANVRIVDAPFTPEIPVKPVKSIALAIALLLGLFIGGGLAFLKNALFGGISDPHDIEQNTGISVYAVLPHSAVQEELFKNLREGGGSAGILVRSNSRDPVVESLRTFRTALQFSMSDASNNLVMLTGPTAGVGKSFVSVNLAELLGASGKRVLLIDADLRKGYLNKYLGVGRDLGLVDLITGAATVSEVIHREKAVSFDFIATGVLPPNPYELLSSQALKDCLEALQSEYDVILLDAPPVLPVADSHALGAFVGTTYLVTRYEMTSVGEIQEAAKRLVRVGASVKGVLFNGVSLRAGGTRYGGKYSRYRYDSYNYYTYGKDD